MRKLTSNIVEARLYEKLGKNRVRCNTCERKCIIDVNEYGFCRTRININGRLYTITYGNLSSIESRPIEIKPFFHFWPGSRAITFSTWSCNFTCPWCQNWTLSKQQPPPYVNKFIPPEKIVEKALKHGDQGTCVSFNEPTLLFEYSLDVFRLTRKYGLYNTYVSNGYMTIDALKMLNEAGLNGLKIDVKGGREEYLKYNGANVDVVWRNAKVAKELGIHVEIVYLVVTGATDSEETILDTIERHLRELGPDTPLHFTRYYPAYIYDKPPTSIKKLEWCYVQAKKMGVKYPYIGNVLGHKYENTYCPNCNTLLVKRWGTRILEYNIVNGKCPKCGEQIPIVGKYIREK